MRKLVFVALVMVLAASASADQEYNLPELHVIKTATLAPAYGCRSEEEFQKGYRETALFLSDYSKKRNSPDLLFNGACRGKDFFDVSTAGDDMALIADLGTDVQVEKITAHGAFTRTTDSAYDYTRFVKTVPVTEGHTYAVLLNKREIRGLFVFTVVNHVENQRALLKYAVKEYQILNVKAAASGFDWYRENYDKPEAKS
jgi:hypothetical protein